MPGIAVVSVPVTDQDRAIAFYTTHLGFSVVADVPMGPEMRWVQLRAGDEQATITLTTWFDTMTAGSLEGLVLDVADADGVRDGLLEAGVECSELETSPGAGSSRARTRTATGSSSRGRADSTARRDVGAPCVRRTVCQEGPKTMIAPVYTATQTCPVFGS